jgi:ferredoxin-NADP reductase
MKLTLAETKNEVSDVASFIFTPEEPLVWKAGQFMHVMLPHADSDDRGAERWFTISSAPFEERPMITTRIATEKGSTFKRALHTMQPGDSVEMDYIDGDFTVEDTTKNYIFIAGGIGITPFHSILKEADHAGVGLNVTLLYANRGENVVYKDELEAFAEKNPNIKIFYITSPARIDEAAVRQYVPDLAAPMFYVSGPEPMVKSLQEVLIGMSVPAEHIKIDDFPGYPAD